MAKSNSVTLDFAFFKSLQDYYLINKARIKRNYTGLTRKFLNYNDKTIRPEAFLRKPQFEALEMYIFIKEFLNNKQVKDIFEDYIEGKNNFSKDSFYVHATDKAGQMSIMHYKAQDYDIFFEKVKQVSENYPNYIYALTMGLGKTVLMATCIYYEFLVANKHPKDKRFCHNALVFAPDKTVLESLREIVTLDKTLIVPPEYARVLDANIKIHFLDDTSTTLNTLDDSDFNIIISNTQKIIVKKKQKKQSPIDVLINMPKVENKNSSLLQTLAEVYGDKEIAESDLIFNQRFRKLCRLSQIGVYVDEAHHLFGTKLKDELQGKEKGKDTTSLRYTINLLASELEKSGTSIVGCYNYTGTPYVKNEILPEVVYAYGLRESISRGYLKEASVKGFANVKNEEFLRAAITEFWDKYGNKRYEGLAPKLAIFGSKIEEVTDEIQPIVEKILRDLNIPISKIVVNVGDTKVTKAQDIHDFNNLDNQGTNGAEKQFVLLVNKGREGWNCRSLFGVAMYRNPSSKVFVLQATMRCLRQISDVQQKATVFLSKENMDILNEELQQNFRMSIEDMEQTTNTNIEPYQVRVKKDIRLTVKEVKHSYELIKKEYEKPINFKLDIVDFSRYQATMYEQQKLGSGLKVFETNIDSIKENIKFSSFTLIGEIAKYLNESCIKISKVLNDSVDGISKIVEVVNKYNEILYDIIIPRIFESLYEVKVEESTVDKEICLLHEPRKKGYYEFKAKPELVITEEDKFIREYKDRSFHADTYCFDSRPEKQCFLQYLYNTEKVKKIYFTGMFTSKQGDLAIPYCDPETNKVRYYYPDFLAEMVDGTYQLIEVKADHMIEDAVVKAKAEAASEIAVASSMEYIMYKASRMERDIFSNDDIYANQKQISFDINVSEKVDKYE